MGLTLCAGDWKTLKSIFSDLHFKHFAQILPQFSAGIFHAVAK